jgi:hypothetical protein
VTSAGWLLLVLLAVLVRQVANAMPLALYIPGPSTYRDPP